jgi:hypothetical protein
MRQLAVEVRAASTSAEARHAYLSLTHLAKQLLRGAADAGLPVVRIPQEIFCQTSLQQRMLRIEDAIRLVHRIRDLYTRFQNYPDASPLHIIHRNMYAAVARKFQNNLNKQNHVQANDRGFMKRTLWSL